ncbi:hypothetical protein CLAIMM_05574 isoform 2, partial [Cladophialophora immunda]
SLPWPCHSVNDTGTTRHERGGRDDAGLPAPRRSRNIHPSHQPSVPPGGQLRRSQFLPDSLVSQYERYGDSMSFGPSFCGLQLTPRARKLRARYLHEQLIDMPQIIVVDDQSSGKSSILKAMIRMPLPRDSRLCTRFAKQIIFKRCAGRCTRPWASPASKTTLQAKARPSDATSCESRPVDLLKGT